MDLEIIGWVLAGFNAIAFLPLFWMAANYQAKMRETEDESRIKRYHFLSKLFAVLAVLVSSC
jgi:hypothetical protein